MTIDEERTCIVQLQLLSTMLADLINPRSVIIRMFEKTVVLPYIVRSPTHVAPFIREDLAVCIFERVLRLMMQDQW